MKSGIAKLAMASFYYHTPLPTISLLPEVFRQTLKALRSRIRERERERENEGKGGTFLTILSIERSKYLHAPL